MNQLQEKPNTTQSFDYSFIYSLHGLCLLCSRNAAALLKKIETHNYP